MFFSLLIIVVSFLIVNGHAAGAVDGWFLAAAVGLSFDDEFVAGGGEPVDGDDQGGLAAVGVYAFAVAHRREPAGTLAGLGSRKPC